jgi:DNA-binding response OmpR family regulator
VAKLVQIRDMKKILFIEDESALQKTFKDVLEKEGYQMISALDGESGLKLARTQKPDLILLDLILPKKDGFEVLKELKEDESTKGIPVIVLTNLEDIESVEKAIELGATTYLVKAQYTLEEVIQKVKKAIK